MKKILSVLLITGLTFGASAQDKKIRGGLVTGFTLNTLSTNSTKIERDGIGAGFVIGMTGEYNVNQNIAFSGGIEFNIESFSVNYGDVSGATTLRPVFYSYDDTEILDGDEAKTGSKSFQVLDRKFRAKYVTIPLYLKFQTNMIGDFKYYGKMGLRTRVLAGVRMDDEGFESTKDANNKFVRDAVSTVTKENMQPNTIKKGLALMNVGIGIYGGAEWNFTGNTNLFVEAGFVYGVTPNLWQKSEHLVETAFDASSNKYDRVDLLDVKNNPMHTFELKVGLLF